MKHKPIKYQKRRFSTSWARLPLPALVEVMKYLSNQDRVSCAQVCHHWENAFASPMLWREGVFEFGGSRFRPVGQKSVLYAQKLGRHLRHLTILCRRLTSHTCETIMRYLRAFLESLAECGPPALYALEIEGLELEFWRYGQLREQVAVCLNSFLQDQKNLKMFRMPRAQFALLPGVEILETLAEWNGSSLETLSFEFFFHSHLAVWQMDRFQTLMKNFTNLRDIAINYCCMSDNLVRSWADVLKRKLQYLRIRSCDNEPYGHVISNDVWSLLTSSCPDLRVDLFVFGFGHSNDLLPILAPCIPLSTFNLFTGYDSGLELRLSAVLNHVSTSYHRHLRDLDLQFDNYHDNVNDALVQMITRCRNLTSLRVKAQISLEVARYICRMLEEGRTTLNRVDLMLCELSAQEMNQLHDLNEDMSQVVKALGIDLDLHDDQF